MKASFMILWRSDGWRVARTTGSQVDLSDPPCPPDDLPGLRTLLREWGYHGGPVCLALPGEIVYNASIDCLDLPRKQRRSVMTYRLEEQLPQAVESLTVDFLPPAGSAVMGLAVPNDRIRPLLEALTGQGIEPSAIVPEAMLALWQALRERPGDWDFVLLADSKHVDVVRLAGAAPLAWTTVSDEGDELLRAVKLELVCRPNPRPRTLIVSARPEWFGALEPLPDTQRLEEAPAVLAARAAARVVAGEPAGWVDFRRDALRSADTWGPAARAVRLAAALAAALALLLPAALMIRSYRYERQTREYLAGQQAIWREVMPNRSVPGSAIRRHVQAEYERLYGISGLAQDAPVLPSALNALRQVLRALPPDLRFAVSDLRLDGQGVLLEGQARNHPDALVLAQTLRQGGVLVEAPKTERQGADNVTFVMTGPLPQPAAAGPASAGGPAPAEAKGPPEAAEPDQPPAELGDEVKPEADEPPMDGQADDAKPAAPSEPPLPRKPWMQRRGPS